MVSTTSFFRRLFSQKPATKPIRAPLKSALRPSQPRVDNTGSLADVFKRQAAARPNSLAAASSAAGLTLLREQVMVHGTVPRAQVPSLIFAHVAYASGKATDLVNRPLPVGVKGTQVSSAIGVTDRSGAFHVYAWVLPTRPTRAKAKVRFADA